ncbi:hypothetical protein ACJO2E_00875 [Marinobacter sp. M1N3S26]|uniref:hypothetical protein n=1 Tax=unclassified Marinobacter TaxID=83889 RepID=UPI00387B06C7
MAADERAMEQMLKLSNLALLVSVVGVVATVVCAYPLAGSLSLPAQVAAHIFTLLFATTLKLSYITRLISLRRLDRPVH